MPEWSAPAQYRLKQRAYISPLPGKPQRLMEAGSVVTTTTRPGPHMEPVDETARAAIQRAALDPHALNPTLRMPVVGGFSEAHAMQLQAAGLLTPDAARAADAEARAARAEAELAKLQAKTAPVVAAEPAAEPPAPKTPPPPPPPKAPKPA